MIIFLFFLAIFVTAFFGIALFVKWVKKRKLLDIPNERSSHETPTPRGGGVVIVIVSIASYLLIAYFYPASFSWGYIVGAILIAVVSWLDDLYSIWFVWRFLAHSAAAIVLISDVGYWHGVNLPFVPIYIELGIFGAVITFLWITWLLNAFNFMDGIDGIAGLQALIAASAWMILSYIANQNAVSYFAGAVAVTSFAFLLHNWHPARIFMGDVGSAFLGFTFAALPLLVRNGESIKEPYNFAIVAILFFWFFLFDTIVTFFYRLTKGKNIFSAHREHIYQKLVLSGMSHSKVTIIYGLLAIITSISTILSISFLYQIGLVVIAITTLLTVVLIFIFVRCRRNSLTR